MAISISVSDSISLFGSFAATVRDSEGKVVREIKPEPTNPKPPIKKDETASVERKYVFADWSGSEDVFELARKYLTELRAVVEDGIAKVFFDTLVEAAHQLTTPQPPPAQSFFTEKRSNR